MIAVGDAEYSVEEIGLWPAIKRALGEQIYGGRAP